MTEPQKQAWQQSQASSLYDLAEKIAREEDARRSRFAVAVFGLGGGCLAMVWLSLSPLWAYTPFPFLYGYWDAMPGYLHVVLVIFALLGLLGFMAQTIAQARNWFLVGISGVLIPFTLYGSFNGWPTTYEPELEAAATSRPEKSRDTQLGLSRVDVQQLLPVQTGKTVGNKGLVLRVVGYRMTMPGHPDCLKPEGCNRRVQGRLLYPDYPPMAVMFSVGGSNFHGVKGGYTLIRPADYGKGEVLLAVNYPIFANREADTFRNAMRGSFDYRLEER